MERRLAGLGAEIEKMKAQALEEAGAEGERMRAESERAIQKMREQAEQEIAAGAKAARQELRAYGADLAVSLAERRIRERLTPDRRARCWERCRRISSGVGRAGREDVLGCPVHWPSVTLGPGGPGPGAWLRSRSPARNRGNRIVRPGGQGLAGPEAGARVAHGASRAQARRGGAAGGVAAALGPGAAAPVRVDRPPADGAIGDVREAFQAVMDERPGLVRADVASARELGPEERERILASLARLTGRRRGRVFAWSGDWSAARWRASARRYTTARFAGSCRD